MEKAKGLLWTVVVLLILGAAMGGYYARPRVDLHFVDYPVIQDAALYGVQMYEYVAERLADYPTYQEDIELVALEYGDIDIKIRDAKLLESMKDDWRYDLVRELEKTFPIARVLNVGEENEICTIELYFWDNWEETRSKESLDLRLEITARAIELMVKQFPDYHLSIAWVRVEEYQCFSDQCVRALVSVSMDSMAEHLVAWAGSPKEELFSELVALELAEKVQVYVDSVYTPYIFIVEELPRPSDDKAPWDYSGFFEED